MLQPDGGPYTIRVATPTDAAELARLLTALGHPTTVERIHAFWHDWSVGGNLALVVDRGDAGLLGLATLHTMVVLHRPRPVARVTSLIVDEGVRGRGIGSALLAAAEERLRRNGCGLLEITSNIRRDDAHKFYEARGYARSSYRFVKMLSPSD